MTISTENPKFRGLTHFHSKTTNLAAWLKFLKSLLTTTYFTDGALPYQVLIY